jgi:hypothetical protein
MKKIATLPLSKLVEAPGQFGSTQGIPFFILLALEKSDPL